jgi:hypothetical protein
MTPKELLMTINLVGTADPRAARFRRIARAATVAGALVLGIGAFGHTAVASAEWDIEYYDRCLRIGTDPAICCLNSGGKLPTVGDGCIAPPLEQSYQGATPFGPVVAQPILHPMPTNGAAGDPVN